MTAGRFLGGASVTAALACALAPSTALAGGSFIGRFSTISTVASTVPANGDVNPYGLAVVPHSTGRLVAGDVLVSNFNAASNLQGTGTTIVEVAPSGETTVFAQIDPSRLPGRCPGGVGLTTALSILPHGFVVVGSLPTTDGTPLTAGAGCLIVLDRQGRAVETLSGHGINGPWDMTATGTESGAVLFVTNVLNGTVAGGGAVVDKGTVLRIGLHIEDDNPPRVTSRTIIGSGFGERTDPNALVVGPTGIGLAKDGTLYVADSVESRIAAIPDALVRKGSAASGLDVSAGGALNDPLGLAIAPNGDILTVNGGDGNIVETTPLGVQLPTTQLDGSGSPPGAGALFGLAVAPHRSGVYFVDDATNTLDLLH
jgi:hypothetical protein